MGSSCETCDSNDNPTLSDKIKTYKKYHLYPKEFYNGDTY